MCIDEQVLKYHERWDIFKKSISGSMLETTFFSSLFSSFSSLCVCFDLYHLISIHHFVIGLCICRRDRGERQTVFSPAYAKT